MYRFGRLGSKGNPLIDSIRLVLMSRQKTNGGSNFLDARRITHIAPVLSKLVAPV
jgi:hypothetical protein